MFTPDLNGECCCGISETIKQKREREKEKKLGNNCCMTHQSGIWRNLPAVLYQSEFRLMAKKETMIALLLLLALQQSIQNFKEKYKYSS